MLKTILKNKYLLYAGTLIFTRGIEYLVLLFAAGYLVKEEYGQLEFYKKVIEVGSSVIAFGFPALIMSYTRSSASKAIFLSLSTLTVGLLALIATPILFYFNALILLIPLFFYALFFNGGILQSYLLVQYNSNFVSIYKIVVSVLFYAIIFGYVYSSQKGAYAYVWVNYILIAPLVGYLGFLLYQKRALLRAIKKYVGLFKKLLLSSFTLVVSNFANLMFLYTDIFVINWVSINADAEIADFSFALNIASILLIAPLTLVQVNIEKLKNEKTILFLLHKKIIWVVLPCAALLLFIYFGLINYLFYNYQATFLLFIIILIAKVFHALSSLFGTNLLIFKKFKQNLFINLGMLMLNILLCYVGYIFYGIIGLAMCSAWCLLIRFGILFYYNKKLLNY